MHAIPKFISGRQLDPTGKYRCPLCRVQSSSDQDDTGWVACPMLNGEMICVGSCIDHQAIARSEDFQHHPYRNDFDQLASKSGHAVLELRSICLRHQLEIIDEQLMASSEDADALNRLRRQIAPRIAE